MVLRSRLPREHVWNVQESEWYVLLIIEDYTHKLTTREGFEVEIFSNFGDLLFLIC